MKENPADSPFEEEVGGGEVLPAQPDEPVQPLPAEAVTEGETVQPVPEDKIPRLEAEIQYLRDRAEETETALAGLKKQTGRLLMLALLLACVFGFVMFRMGSQTTRQIADLKESADTKAASLAPVKNNPAIPVPDHPFQVSSVSFFHWTQGSPPVQLIRGNEGLCFLTKVTGHFEGGGESVRLWIDKDGYWYLGGESHQQDVSAECAVLKY